MIVNHAAAALLIGLNLLMGALADAGGRLRKPGSRWICLYGSRSYCGRRHLFRSEEAFDGKAAHSWVS